VIITISVSPFTTKADMARILGDVRLVPLATKVQRSKKAAYSITSLAVR
jgi:hypothetical protein